MAPRVLVLSSTTSYRTDDFLRAAQRSGVEAVLGTNRCHELAELWPREAFGGSVPIEFRHEADAARRSCASMRAQPFDAIVPTDDPRRTSRRARRSGSGCAATASARR